MSNGFGCHLPTEQSAGKSPVLRPAIDAEVVQQQWLSQFEALEDPRGLQGREHALVSIVLIAILGV